MNYFKQKQRIATILEKDSIEVLISDYINEVRDELGRKHPFRFLETTKTISLAASTYTYAIDKNEGTGRYGGWVRNIYFDNASGNDPVLLAFLDNTTFDYQYPFQKAGDPTRYKISGGNIVLNYIPDVTTNKTIIVSYFMLPDMLDSPKDESYVDKKYYHYIINRVCYRMTQEIIELGEIKKSLTYRDEYEREYSNIILSESAYLTKDSQVNIFS